MIADTLIRCFGLAGEAARERVGAAIANVKWSDAELVTRASAGDAESFEHLVRRYFRAAYAVALGVAREPADADDICQDAWVRAWERLHQCRHPDRFASWLLRLVRNVAYNHLDRARVRRTQPLDSAAAHAGGPDAARRTELAELRRSLLRAIAQLSEAQRFVLLLSDLEGWRHARIAAALDISEVMSRRHLSDARRRMREILPPPGGADRV